MWQGECGSTHISESGSEQDNQCGDVFFYQTNFLDSQGPSGSAAVSTGLIAFDENISTTHCIGYLLFTKQRLWNILYFFPTK